MEPMRSFVDGYVMSMSIGCGLFIRYMLLRLSINMCILCGYFRCWLQLAIWHIALHEVCLDHGSLLQVACFLSSYIQHILLCFHCLSYMVI